MTLKREGWLGGRPYAIIRDEDGTPVKMIDLRTLFETEVDADVFVGMNWTEIENKARADKTLDPHSVMANESRPQQPSTVIASSSDSDPIPGVVEIELDEDNPLDGIDWGSGKAAEMAAEAGLEFDDFVGREPGGAKGFNADDVKQIIEEKEED